MPEQHAQQARRPHHHHHHPRHHTEWFRFISGALPADTFHVVRFTGTEGLNKLFSFRLELVSARPDVDTGKVLAARARFVILREDAPPAVFHGYPSKVEQGGHFGDHTSYTVELQPAFRKLADLRHSAVFLRQTAQDAARELLRSLPFFKLEHEFRLTRKYPEREFAMQYDESLFDYILFRMEEQGAYFYFAPDEDRLIFADGPLSHERADLDLAYSPPSGLDHNIREEILHSFTLSHTPLPRQAVLRCYDWKDPKRVIVGRAPIDPEGVGDVYLAGENAESEEEAQRLAQIRAEERICRGRVFTGASSSPLLRPGVVFNLTNHYNPTFNRAYLVTEITHEGAQEAYISLGLGLPVKEGSDHLFYRNGFTCIPSDVPYRPARTAPRAKIPGVLRAFVDGAANTRPEMDEYGRYKLIFPFDISGRKGGNASCWIRMAGPQAGRDSGLAFPLLPGTEVVVSFIDGDPDRPVITGALPNGETGSISGPSNANFSGIRTAGGNQIAINDTNNKQGIALSTAAGLGYSISSGSPGTASEQSDMNLKAASVGAADISAAFKSVATGYKVMQAAASTNKWYSWLSIFTTALAGGAGDVLKSLAADYGKQGDKEKADGLKWGSDISKALVPLAAGFASIMKAEAAPNSTYGVTLLAGKEKALSILEATPSKARMAATIFAWIGGRAVAAGTTIARDVATIDENTEDAVASNYGDIRDKAKEALKKEAAYQDKSYDFIKDGKTDEALQYAHLTKDLGDAINEMNKRVQANKLAGDTSEEAQKLAARLDELTELKKKLDAARTKAADTGADAYHTFAKNDAIRDIVTTTATGLLPEITAMITTLIGLSKAKKLGGVSISSPDNNVNLAAKRALSLNSQTGVLLDTGMAPADASAWGLEGTNHQPQVAAGMGGWQVDDDERAVSSFFPENAAPTKKFVAANTELFSVNANYHLAATSGEWMSRAKSHLLAGADHSLGLSPKGIYAATSGDEARVSLQTRGGMMVLSKYSCHLANGEAKCTLTKAPAANLTAGDKSRLVLTKDKAQLKGGGASVVCAKDIDIKPGSGGKVQVGKVVFEGATIKGTGNGILDLLGEVKIMGSPVMVNVAEPKEDDKGEEELKKAQDQAEKEKKKVQ